MTELLKQAVERVRQLPPERQDEIARIILQMIDDWQRSQPERL